ncbi:MAG: hypothetical protein FJ398_15595 [Verrucomicrobia bacterium]|nr:hypothetical protein [Verrucomicrobiota bacterium]
MKALASIKTQMLSWLWRRVLTCKEVTQLASQSLDRTLPRKQRFQMRVHFLLCVWYQRYARHLHFIHRAAPRYADHMAMAAPQRLTDNAKRRMKQALQNQRDR